MTASPYTLATFVCADTRESDAQVLYPLMGILGPEERRLGYWRLAATNLLIAKRVHPEARHILYTNDNADAWFGLLNLRTWLADAGIEVRPLPFTNFKLPVGMSLRFANAYYRFEVIQDLAARGENALLMDADCLLVRPDAALMERLSGDFLLVYDIYSRSHRPQSGRPHGISMEDMGNTFHHISDTYPVKYPVWLGTEVIGGSAAILHRLSVEMAQFMGHFAYHYKRGSAMPEFPNGTGFFNNDEFAFSYVANQIGTVEYLNPHMKRMYALPFLDNLEEGDELKAIWHLPSEKNSGLLLLCEQMCNPASPFWKLDVDELPLYIGGLVGVPKRLNRGHSHTPIKDFVRNLRGRMGVLMRNRF